MCKCALCKEHRIIERMIKKKDVKALSAKVVDIQQRLELAELDRDVDELILAGKWPSAEKTLRRALDTAIEINRSRNSTEE